MSGLIRVLHVDDEPDFADLTATYLQREDDRFSVETATSADEGLQLLADSQIDCIVSDYQMPGMNGIEFLETVSEEYPNLPFILYTGKGSEEVASEAIRTGITDYLKKKGGTDDYSLLANRIINAVDSQRRKQRVTFFETLQNELTELSIDFLRTGGSDVDTLIDETLETIGTLVDADRTYVFDIDHEAETLSNTHEWCAAGIEPQIDMLQDIPQSTLPWWMQKLENFENIRIQTVSTLPPEAEAEQEILQEQNIESLIVTPLISNDALVGFIGFDWVEEQEAWSDEFINILRMVGELITTARTRNERDQKLRRSQRIIENSTDIATIIDPEGTMTYVSPAVEDILGYNPEELVGDNGFRYQPEKTKEAVADGMEYVLENPAETKAVQTQFRRADGSWCWIESTLRNYVDDDVIDGILVSSREVSERKKRKQELQRQNNRLNEFASVVSHDLRNPLNVAQSRATLLENSTDSDVQEHLPPLVDALNRMESIIEDTLTLARQGETVGEMNTIQVIDLIRECWAGVETTEATLEVADEFRIRGDGDRVRNVFENLFRNAVEHGGEDVTVRAGQIDEDGIYVEDDGQGISPDEREEIFEPGYTSADGGTGFGLTIVKGIAEAHGWELSVTDGDDGGARFRFDSVEVIAE